MDTLRYKILETESIIITADNSSSAEITNDYSALSKDELLAVISDLTEKNAELQKQINQIQKPPPNDWHSLMYAWLHIVFYQFKQVDIKHEFPLGAQPPRADFIVVDENETIDMDLEIFTFFRKTNIIEFKSPDDKLSEKVLWKVIGYAALYIAKYGVSDDDITVTLFRDTKPVKLLKELGDVVDADEENGIYRINDWKVSFPIQIVVTSRLKGTEYAGFRAISKKPRVEDIKQILKEVVSIKDPELIGWFRDYLDLFSKIDSEMVEEAKERYPAMAKTWRDIFGVDEEIKDAVDTAVDAAVNNTTRIIYFTLVQDGDLTVERAAEKSGMSTDEFIRSMNEYVRSQNAAVPV